MPEVVKGARSSQQVDSREFWHAMAQDDVLERLQSKATGLNEAEAADRKARFGPNSLPQAKQVHPFWRFLAQFRSPLIYFLLVGALAAGLLGHIVDAAVIMAVVLVNAVVGFAQEGKAEQALGAIRDLIAPQAQVMRGGQRLRVDAANIVPGDIVIVEAGDRVSADLRLLRSHSVTADEALLTGESVNASKQAVPVARDAALGDRSSMLFSGTLVATGQATGVVTATGSQTQIGRISGMLEEVQPLSTPLLRQINQFGRSFTRVVLIGAVALFAFAVLVRDYLWDEALIAVIAVSVGIVPEGLPAVITITLAIGVQRMAKRNAVIRKLPAVETLGATSVICTDKTGTLTRNEMTVRNLAVEGYQLQVSGAGYAPDGTLTATDGHDEAPALAAAAPIIRCGLLCNDADLRESENGWSVVGDPMEGALVTLALKAGAGVDRLRTEWQRLDTIPFDAEYRYMATMHRGPGGEHVIFVKGAPEVLLDMSGADPAAWQERIVNAAGRGERVLGFGMKRLDHAPPRLTHADLEQGVELLGIMGFIDPPREEAVAAIAQCRSAGIAVKMITGDHVATALAIARQLDLAEEPEAVTGAELDGLSDGELAALAQRASVFARTSPEHKLRIVRALQSLGAIVAMTGDGVNDAPSLKQADVGTAMGCKGTEAAKEASEMVLLDDNFSSIVAAVHEGRTVYDNIRKVITWTIPTNGGETLLVVLAILLGFALPMTATQILWANLLLAATLGLVLAFEPPEQGVMQRPPRDPATPLLTPFLLWRVVLVSVLFTAVALGVFFAALEAGRGLEVARTMVVNTIVVAEIFYLFNVRYLHMRSLTLRGALGTPAVLGAIAVVIVAQLLFTYAPFMQELFDSRPLTLADGALIIGLGICLMLLLEGEKLLMRRLGWFAELRS
ncbi:cation-translocating P-type ATPase [Novosphingobium sp. M1R2S20]|uniref:Cation-translocating P-type ATPase n=1 Tax=Novosphingobium rhizovicinum TaxID=3228928 RepID=A0ABV3R6C6_9SPHN